MAGFLDSIGSFFQNDIAQPVENFVNNDIVQPVEQSAINTGQAFENLAQNLPQPVQQSAINTGNDASQTLDNLTSMGRQANSALGAVQNFIQHGQVNFQPANINIGLNRPQITPNGVQNPVDDPLATLGKLAYNFALRQPMNDIGNAGLDAARSLDNLAQRNFKAAADYNNLNSPISKLAYQTMFGGSPLQEPTQTKMNPQEVLANVGQIGQDALPFIPGIGEEGALADSSNAALRGIGEAMPAIRQAAAYGASAGLAGGRNQSLPEQLLNAGEQATAGAAGAGAIAGGLPLAGEAVSKAIPAVSDALGNLGHFEPTEAQRGFFNPKILTGRAGKAEESAQEVTHGGTNFVLPPNTNPDSPLMYHGGRSSFSEVQSRGVKVGQNQDFGPGIYFTDGSETAGNFSSNLEAKGAQNPNYAVPLDQFNLLKIDQSPEEFAKSLGGPDATPKDLPQLIQRLGNYDGFYVTNPDSAVGNTYVVTNTQKLDGLLRGEGTPPPMTGQSTQTNQNPPSNNKPAEQTPPSLTNAKGLFNQLLNRDRNVIGGQGEPGKQVASWLEQSRAGAQTMAGKWLADMPTVGSLTKSEFENFVDAAEGKAQPASDKIAQAVKEWSAVRDEIHAAANQGGQLLDTGKIENYFPHSWKPGTFTGDMYKKAIDHLVSTGQAANPDEAATMLNTYMGTGFTRRFGNLEKSRMVDLPGYQKTKEALYNYVNGAAKRVAQAQTFGPNDEKVMEKIGQIANLGGDAQTVKHLFDVAVENEHDTAAAQKVASAISKGLRPMSLSFSALSHAQQGVNIGSVAGVMRTLGSVPEALSPEGKEFALRAGVTLDRVLDSAREPNGFIQKVLGKTTAPALKNVIAFYRTLAAEAGRSYGQDLAEKAVAGDSKAAQELLRMGISKAEVVGGKLTESGQIKAARDMVKRTMFNADAQDLPVWATSPWGHLISQFKQFPYNQTSFVAKELLAPARRGNVLPLARFLVMALPAGFAANELTQAAKGQPTVLNGELGNTSPGQLAYEAYSKAGAFGLPGEIVQAATNSYPGETAAQKFDYLMGSVAGPAYSKLTQTGTNIYQALTPDKPGGANNQAPLEREGLRSIPIVGNMLASNLVPTKAQQQANGPAPVSAAENPAGPNFLSPAQRQAIDTKLTQLRAQYKQYANQNTADGNTKALAVQGQINQLEHQLHYANLQDKASSLSPTTGQDQFTSVFQAKQAQAEGASIAKQVQEGKLTPDEAAPLFAQLGLDPQQTKYAIAAALPDGQQAQFAASELNSTQDPTQLSTITKNLIDAKVLTAPVIAQMYQQGLISLGEANSLGKLVKAANPSLATLTKGLNAKPKKGRAAKAPKVGKVSTGKTTLLSGKASSGKSLGISGTKTLKTPTISAPKLRVPKTASTTSLKTPAFKVPKVKVRIGKM